KLPNLVKAVTTHRSFSPAMLLPGQLAEVLNKDLAQRSEWQGLLDVVVANASSCFVPDLNVVIRCLGRRRHLREALQLVDAMVAGGVRPDSETYEFIANAAVRKVDKVASAKT